MSKNLIKGSKGFTLIELLVVIAIIGILSSVVLASLSTARAKSRDARRISDVGQIQMALEISYDASSTYPVVATASAGPAALNALAPAFIPKLPVDPTTNSGYFYGGATTSYIIAANLELPGNAALTTDADATSPKNFGLTTSYSTCLSGTAVPDQCYDVTN